MPSEFFHAVGQNPKTLSLVLIFMGLCLVFVVLYFVVQRPKKGTIEWIQTYDRERFRLFTYEPFTLKDVLFWLLTFVSALFLSGLRFVMHDRLGLVDSFAYDPIKMLLTGAAAIFCLSLSFYGFFRLFYTSRCVAFLVTCISCALLSNNYYSVVLLLFSWIFLYIWICNYDRNYKAVHRLYFFLAFAFYLLTLMTCWATLYLAPVYIAGAIYGKVIQWHQEDRKKGRLFLSLLMLMITCAVVALVMWLFYYAHKNETMNLLTTALSADTYHDIIPTFLKKTADITLPQKPGAIMVRQDLFRPILFITSLPTVFYGIAKRKIRALTATVCAVLFLAAWIFGGVDIMCAGAMLSIGWMFKGFRDRNYKWLAAMLGFAVLAFYYISLLV